MTLHIQITEQHTNRSIQLNESAQYNEPIQNDKTIDVIAKIEKSTQKRQPKKHTPKNENGISFSNDELDDEVIGTKEAKTATDSTKKKPRKKRKRPVFVYSGMKT